MNFKGIVLFLLVGTLITAGCKKSSLKLDSRASIIAQESKMTTATIPTFKIGGALLKAGAIILYKTNLGNYGKLKFVKIESAGGNGLLTIDILTYKTNGSILIDKKGFTVVGNYYCDLDKGTTMMTNNAGADFNWSTTSGMSSLLDASIISINTAKFFLYSN